MTTTEHLPYHDSTHSVSDRVADLLARMTLDEKLAQLGSVWVFQVGSRSGFEPARAGSLLTHGIGHITRVCGASSLTSAEAARLNNDLQRHLLDHTRLGIPALVHEEICSGLMAREATVFPQAIGVASTWKPEHNRSIADAVRLQMRSIGAHQGLSPVLDVCRDPRWGRLEETYGEDPYMVARMGIEFVRGLQGDNLGNGVVATAKHFVGYGASDGGFNWAPARIPERELRDVYLAPFEAAVREAGLASVMNGYHELDGIPCGANRDLLTGILRDEWGFDGTVVSDYFAVKMLCDYHHIATSWVEAAAIGLRSGIDIEIPSTECYGQVLAEALAAGSIGMAEIDLATSRSLALKFRLGLFDNPFVDDATTQVHTRTPQQVDLARQVAADSLVLLANDGALPLSATVARVALIGPNADSARHMLGDYSYVTHVESLTELLKSGANVFAMPIEHGVDLDPAIDLGAVATVRSALTDAMPGADITFARGCGVTGDDRSGFDEAIAAARASDVAIMVMGERSGLTADCTTGESRDVSSLNLPGVQEELVAAVAATGTPIVLVLVAGRPVGSVAAHAAASAVLMVWLPGEQGAVAIAEALVGRTSPGGKLPISYPRSSGQIPVFYAHKVSGGRSHWKGEYVDLSNEPMYVFGHGLSYTTFEVDVDPVDAPQLDTGEAVEIVIHVSNTGDVAGDEVVQVYSFDPVASVTRPVRELKGFQRVSLEPGETLDVTFNIPVASFGFSGRDFTHVVEPGVIELFVGTSSANARPIGTFVIRGDRPMAVVRAHTDDVSVGVSTPT